MSGYRVFGASVRGPDHEREEVPCQDAWAQGPLRRGDGEGGWAICLCDGAGSAAHADVGARVVSRAVVEALGVEGGAPLEEALRAACSCGREALMREATSRGVAPEALACTLVAIAAEGDRVAIAHLGDGAVVGKREGAGDLVMLSAPDRGEYANETWFVSSASWRERLRVGVHTGVEAIAAITDGCEAASLVRGRVPLPFEPFCAPLFAYAAEIEDGEDADGEVARLLDGAALRGSSGDDKTLVVARRRAPP